MNSLQDLQEQQEIQVLESYLLRGVRTIEPRATRCLEGTRTKLLADVNAETDNVDGSNVIWIRGAPGSGKSSLSLTTKSLLQRQRRLVTYFRFDRNESATTTPTALWRRVAYDLGRRFPSLRAQFLKQVREDSIDLDSPLDVFTLLVRDPLSSLTTMIDCPLVIIIDALDECGGFVGQLSPDRQVLLQTLRQWAKLPKYFKLLVTSRPEGDITRILSPISTLIDIQSGNFLDENPQAEASIETGKDIRMFLESRFQQIRVSSPSLSPDWPGQHMARRMVHRAAGNFMWVTTAVNFVDEGINPHERLEAIMSNSPVSVGLGPLYSLYSTILDISFGKIASESPEADVLRSVLGVIVLAQRPFDQIEYTKLSTATPVTTTMVEQIRERLRSVIDQDQSLRFVHKSFDDFLVSKECPSKYAIRQDECQYLLTNLCLTTMTKELHFNMCNLETSCLKNVDIPDITNRVTNGIPSLLAYSCCFFAHHLSLAPFDDYFVDPVKAMVMDKLLYWFEAMSLLGEMNRVSHSILLTVKWLHLSPDDEFKDFLHDTYRFIGVFGHLIAESAPHIYLSALPFAPEYSAVVKHFLPRFPWTLMLSTGRSMDWSSCLFTSEHHKNMVFRAAFSPDEKYFVSGSYDHTICVCDSETGSLISSPFKGDQNVLCVFFDPDGRRIWASYDMGKVICWDIETGNECHVFDTLGHSEYEGVGRLPIVGSTVDCFNGGRIIISAGETKFALWNAETGSCIHELHHQNVFDPWCVSISPNGCFIVGAARGETIIRIWRVVDGSEILGPLPSQPRFKHTTIITALSFSVDSNYAVSGSFDGDILIWDTRTGNTIGPPLLTATWVSAVAYSPKYYLLVSSSGQTNAVTVWNTSANEAILGPLEGHVAVIRTIVLSRDGRRALTTSADHTVRMWDLGRKSIVPATRANEGHSDAVWFVAYSPCGKKMATLDIDCLLVWNTNHPGQPLFKYKTRPGNHYTHLIFSPDGNLIIAYFNSSVNKSGNGIITIWNADTGEFARHLDLNDDNCKHTNITHASFQSTSGQLITCSSNGVVCISSLEDGVRRIVAKLPHIVALAPDGMTVIVRDNNRNPRHYMWSTITQQPLPLTFADDESISNTGYFLRPEYSSSGQFLANAHFPFRDQYQLRVWDIQTGEIVAGPSALEDGIFALIFSPDEHQIAAFHTTSCAIFIYDTSTARMVSGPWGGHSAPVLTLAFSPDGEKLVSGSFDRQLRVWNTVDLLGHLQPSDHLLGVGTHMKDGWVRNSEGLLFWVPKEHRARLVWPHSELLDGHGITTKLELSRFKYGKNWTECFVERQESD